MKLCQTCSTENENNVEKCIKCEGTEFYLDEFNEPEINPPKSNTKIAPPIYTDIENLKNQKKLLLEEIEKNADMDVYELKILRKKIQDLNKKISEKPEKIIPEKKKVIIKPPEPLEIKTEEKSPLPPPINVIAPKITAPNPTIPEPKRDIFSILSLSTEKKEEVKDFGSEVVAALKDQDSLSQRLDKLIEQNRKTQILILIFMIVSLMLYLISISL